MSTAGKMGILVGGGPAPGINSVITAATIRARLGGVEVLGIRDGFEHLMEGDLSEENVFPLTIAQVSRIHFRGGSMLGISRANPTRDPAKMRTAVESLRKLGITMLVTIGGDDTALSAMTLKKAAGGDLRVVHVPKTIDNDLDLPPTIDTFGFQTAQHVGAQIVRDIMTDARTTSRWYLIIAMGRKAGHLALGIGKSTGSTLTLIPEEFPDEKVKLSEIVDVLVGAILKRRADNRRDGVAVIAEGVMLNLDLDNLPESVRKELADAPLDDHGHLRLGDVNSGAIIKKAVEARLVELGAPKTTVVAKNVGYELRCADPIPFDVAYTRDLGYCAAKYILGGGDGAMVSMQGGHFVPVDFDEMLDPVTKKTKVRMVDIHSTRYAIARRYMIRLRRDDFPAETLSGEDVELWAPLAPVAALVNLSVEQFVKEFKYLTRHEPPPLVLK